MADEWIIKKDGRYLNTITGKTVSEATAKRYKRFYKRGNRNAPFSVSTGNSKRLRQAVERAKKKGKRLISLSPNGPVYVGIRKGRLFFRQVDVTPSTIIKVRPPKPTLVTPPTTPIPTTPTTEAVSPEADVLKFGHAVERKLRRYAIMDLKQNPDKFKDSEELEYTELYPSQTHLYKALLAAQRSDEVGLRLKGGVTRERVNVMAEYLNIPTWKAKQQYFSETTRVEIQRKIHPITRQEVMRFRVYDIKEGE